MEGALFSVEPLCLSSFFQNIQLSSSNLHKQCLAPTGPLSDSTIVQTLDSLRRRIPAIPSILSCINFQVIPAIPSCVQRYDSDSQLKAPLREQRYRYSSTQNSGASHRQVGI